MWKKLIIGYRQKYNQWRDNRKSPYERARADARRAAKKHRARKRAEYIQKHRPTIKTYSILFLLVAFACLVTHLLTRGLI